MTQQDVPSTQVREGCVHAHSDFFLPIAGEVSLSSGYIGLQPDFDGLQLVVELVHVYESVHEIRGVLTTWMHLSSGALSHTICRLPALQAKINDTFNCGLAQSAVFFGQNDITNLLEVSLEVQGCAFVLPRLSNCCCLDDC